jgi:tRNA U34 5-methylaminomethyl-2-thiouridine-forming methyltransferase MnmC
MSSSGYRIVRLASGVHSVQAIESGETFHPVIGPVAEAEALYVRQLKLRERVRDEQGVFVVWDVGLGAAANVLTFLRATEDLDCSIHVISFDHSLDPLRFGLAHAAELGYFGGYESALATLLKLGEVNIERAAQKVRWETRVADFPGFIREAAAEKLEKPHVIMFDAFSPAKNPEMWTQPLFARIFELLDPGRACALPTYSRSTLLRVTLLLAGFFVGAGHATGEKEETTIAANTLDLVEEPLEISWLERIARSTSAEPLWEPVYRQAPIAPGTMERLREHPQFQAR